MILDEPVNGLDPEGILWIRNLLKALAAEGRTIFVSSHLMSEMALIASHLVVIGRGRLIADVGVDELTRMTSRDLVKVRTPEVSRLHGLLAGDAALVTRQGAEVLEVAGLDSAEIGLVAARAGIALAELTPQHASLEEAFMEITRDAVEFVTPHQRGDDLVDVGGAVG